MRWMRAAAISVCFEGPPAESCVSSCSSSSVHSSSRYGNRPRRWHTPNPALLSGLLVCGKCKHNLTPRRYGGRRPDGYTCQADGGGRCGRVGVSLPKVDALITDKVGHLIDRNGSAILKAKRRPKEHRAEQVENIEALQAELDALADAAGQGELPVREYLIARKPLEERLERATTEIAHTVETPNLSPFAAAVALPKRTKAEKQERVERIRDVWEHLGLDRQRDVLATLIERIVVSPAFGARVFDADRVEIAWRV